MLAGLPTSVSAASLIALQTSRSTNVAGQTAASAAPVGLSENFSAEAVGGPAAGWNVVSGSWKICPLVPLRAYCRTSIATSESLNGATWWSDYSIDALVADPDVVAGGVAIIGRVKSANQFYQLELRSEVNGSTPYWYIEKDNDGTWTTLVGGPLHAPDKNPNFRLHLVFAGKQITASIAFDGGTAYRVLGTVTDSAFTAGQVGVRLGYTAVGSFQNILVTLPAAALPSESAGSPSAFVDTIGINAHFEALNYSNVARVHSLIGNLGIRHYRVSAGQILVDGGSYLKEITALHTSFGTKFDVITDLKTSPAQVVKALELLPAGSVDSVEGPNEADAPSSGPGSQYDVHFAVDVAAYTRSLYATIKSTLATSQVTVIGPSFANSGSYAAIGNISSYVDEGNMHNYFAGFNPGSLGWGGGGYGSIDWNIASSAQATGSKPIAATETGYYTAAIRGGVPLDVQAKYVPRLYLEQYRHNVQRSFMYQLIGYNTTNADGTLAIVSSSYVPSPAYNALAGMISQLKDGGLTSASVNYSWGLSGSTTNVDHVLLHKADGTMILALWIEVPSFDPNADGGRGAKITVPVQTVTVNLAQMTGSGVVSTCNIVTGAWSSQPVTVTNGAITLNVSDSVSILEVKPS